MATVGEAKLKLSADGSTLPAEVRAAVAAAMRNVQETLKIEVDADVSRFESKMATILQPREIEVDVDVDRHQFDRFLLDMQHADRDFVVRVALLGNDDINQNFSDQNIGVRLNLENAAAFNARMQDLTRPRTVDVHLNVDQAQIAALSTMTLHNRTVDIRANLTNAMQVEAQLAWLTRPRSVDINVNIDHSQINMILQALQAITSAAGSVGNGSSGFSSLVGSIGKITSAAGTAAGAIALIGIAAAGAGGVAGGAILGITAALGAVSAAAGAVGAAVTGGLAGFVAWQAVLSDDRLYDNMIANVDKVRQAFSAIMETAAPALTRLFDSLPGLFDRLAPSIQRVTDGVSGLIDHLTSKLPEIADQLGPALEKAFNAGVPHMQNMIDNIPRMTEAFGNFMAQLGDQRVVDAANRFWQMLPGAIEKVGEMIPKVAEGFNNMMDWLDEGNLDGFIQGFKDLWDELSSTDWSGTVDSIANLANSFGDLLGSIDGQYVADMITGIATALTAVNTAAGTVVETWGNMWEVISPRNIMDEIPEQFETFIRGVLTKLRDAFKDIPIIGDDIAAAIDKVLGSMPAVKFEFKAEPKIDKTKWYKPLEDGPPAKVKVQIEAAPFKLDVPPKQKVMVDVEAKPFKLDVPPKTKVMVDVEAEPFKLNIPPKQKVMVDVEQTPGFKLNIPPKTKVMVEPDGTPFHNFRPPQPAPVKVKVEADAAAFKADIDAKVKVSKTVTVPIAYGPLPPLNIPAPPSVRVEVHTNADDVAGKINSIPRSVTTGHTVASNIGQVLGQVGQLRVGTSSFHTVSSNVGSVIAQINSLNGRNTSSTHTIKTVETGAGKRMEIGGFTSYAKGGITALEQYANGKLPGMARIQPARRRLIQWAEPSTRGEAFIPLTAAPQQRARSINIWEETGRRLGVWDRVQAALAARAAGAPNLSMYAGAGVGVTASTGGRTIEVHAPISINAAAQPATTGWAVQSTLEARILNRSS